MIRVNGKLCGSVLLALALILFASLAYAELNLKGFADSYHAIRIDEPNDYLASRTRVRVEAQFLEELTTFFVSVNAVQNDVVTEESGVSLMESYIDYADESWDLRAGKQILIWGKGTGIQITDILSPRDYSEYLARDFDDMRLAVDAMKFRLLGEESDLEFIWIPTFYKAVLPTTESPWYIAGDATNDVYNAAVEPEHTFANSELALKYSLYLSAFDFAVSLFHTWEDIPTYHYTVNNNQKTYSPEYHRITYGALEFSIPLGDFVLLGEMALFHGRHYEIENNGATSHIMKDSFDGFLGLDWSPGNDWSLSLQIMDTIIQDYDPRIKDEERRELATFSISKSLLRQKLEISEMLYYHITDEDYFNRLSLEYAVTDELFVSGGVDVFGGKEGGNLSIYDDNDEVWFKIKISF